MIPRLERQHYPRVRPVFAPLDHHLAVTGIVEGAAPGQIHVDDHQEPRAAITWSTHRVYLAGDPGQETFHQALDSLFDQEIIPAAQEAGRVQFVLYYAPHSWETVIEEALAAWEPIQDLRHYYTFRGPIRDWRAELPPAFAMRQIDRALLADTGLENRAELIEEIYSERPSIEAFFDKDFGFCLLHGDEIVSYCLSEHNVGHRCEVGVATVPAYRRRGLATWTVSALVEHALANDITEIGWHCWASNRPSIALAKGAGFEKALEYPTCFAWFKRHDQLLAQAWFATYRSRQYDAAIAYFERAFQARPPGAPQHYNFACCLALAGEHDAAIDQLRLAIDKGWSHVEHMQRDPDLTGLRERAVWKELVAALGVDEEPEAG